MIKRELNLKMATLMPMMCTLKLGTGLKTGDDFRRALTESDCNIGNWADDILDQPSFKVSAKEVEVEIVMVSNTHLGFSTGATVGDTYARAKEVGLGICPAEIGPQLRLHYKDQPDGEWLLIAMEPVGVTDGCAIIFGVGCNGDHAKWLFGNKVSLDYLWIGDDPWVFLR